MNLEGKTVLVTGGAVRIGRAICTAFARAGARVGIHHRNSAGAARELADTIQREGGSAFSVAGDLSRPADAASILSAAARTAGAIDVLVNNAAIFHKDTWATLDGAALQREFDVNLFAPLLLMQAFAAQNRSGAIVNLLDRRIAGLDPSCVAYELAKKALFEATRSAAVAWAPRITVNAVAPGAVLPPVGESPSALHDRAGFIPLGRTIAPDEVADAVVFLARAEAVTGQVLYVDGGQHLVSSPVPDRPIPGKSTWNPA